MKRYARIAVAICMGFIGQASAVAADLPRSDPDRAAILDAARPAADVKFVVKELRKFGDFAFLCALQQTTGGRSSVPATNSTCTNGSSSGVRAMCEKDVPKLYN